MSLKLKPLREQVVVITGASSGIGLVTARMAAKQGARLVLAARNAEALATLANEINAGGGQAIAVPTDVGQEEEVNRLAAAAVAHFGSFDTWVNNAGVSIFGRPWDVTTPDLHRMFDTNFWGQVYGSRAAVRHFAERRGKQDAGALINIGSVFGDRATPVQSTYTSSKFAVHGWTEALRMEVEAAHLPVSVTLIHPGRIDTPYNEHARSYIPQQPAHRGMIYPPEAVAEAILFAAEHPKRDLFVGFQAWAGAAFGHLAPRIMDQVMERYMFWSQRSRRPSRSREDNALYRPGSGLQERGTHEGLVRGASLYARAQMHPGLMAAALGVACTGVVLGVLTRPAGEEPGTRTRKSRPRHFPSP
ncbi:SDR family oxidoreductase [Deinococcus oregonensis]|uniref:SDR family oxidoreductase n=1 Tax=Deinococcus oregonensis TaxID=1805970 RepID=A0ABV6ATU2_9DEIO